MAAEVEMDLIALNVKLVLPSTPTHYILLLTRDEKFSRRPWRSFDTAQDMLDGSKCLGLILRSTSDVRCRQRRIQSQLVGHRVLDDGALEEG